MEPHLRLDLLLIIIACYFALMSLLTIERERYMRKYRQELKQQYVDGPTSALIGRPRLPSGRLTCVDNESKSVG